MLWSIVYISYVQIAINDTLVTMFYIYYTIYQCGNILSIFSLYYELIVNISKLVEFMYMSLSTCSHCHVRQSCLKCCNGNYY